MKKYMVMECHPGYAVVLDRDGRFLKVANLHYEVGQTVADVFEMHLPQAVPQKKKINKWFYSMAAVAACLVLMVASVLQNAQMTYASVYLNINPEVRIDVNREDKVVGLDGLNADGDHLIQNYDYKKKGLELVMEELLERAIDMGYLHEGGQISLVLDADSNEWIVGHGDSLINQLNEYLKDKMSVTIEVADKNAQYNRIIIPVAPSESSYGESDYSSSNDGVTNNNDSDYGPNNDGATDYNDTDYSSNNDGGSDYGADDGDTDNDTSNYDTDDDDD